MKQATKKKKPKSIAQIIRAGTFDERMQIIRKYVEGRDMATPSGITTDEYNRTIAAIQKRGGDDEVLLYKWTAIHCVVHDAIIGMILNAYKYKCLLWQLKSLLQTYEQADEQTKADMMDTINETIDDNRGYLQILRYDIAAFEVLYNDMGLNGFLPLNLQHTIDDVRSVWFAEVDPSEQYIHGNGLFGKAFTRYEEMPVNETKRDILLNAIKNALKKYGL